MVEWRSAYGPPPVESRSIPMHSFKLITVVVLASLLVSASPIQAQSSVRDAFEDLPPPSEQKVDSSVPTLQFHLLAEIPLPGPLPGDGPRLNGELVEIPVAGGIASTIPAEGAIPTVEPSEAGSDPGREPDREPWVEAGDSFRYRSLEGGWILAQRRCRRCRKGWKKIWKLRVAGNTVAPPLAGDDRVFFGALDNRIYCVKARNGHRLWAVDVDGRVSRPLVFWKEPDDEMIPAEGPAPDPSAGSLVLVVTDAGREMVALSASTGQRVATAEISPAEGRLVSVPLATPDGKVVVAQQKYAESDAVLRVYSLREVPPAVTEGNLDYNAPDLRSENGMEERDGAAEGRVEGEDDPGNGSESAPGTLPGHVAVPEDR